MNTSSKKVYLLSLILVGAFIPLCTGFYTYALLTDYSALLGHFGQSAFTDIFLPLLYMLAIIAFAVFGVLFRASLTGREYRASLPSVFAAGFAVLTTLIWLVSFIPALKNSMGTPLSAVFGVLMVVSALFTIAYLILSILPFAVHTGTMLCGTVAVLFPLSYAFYAYFDAGFALNSPIKIFDQVTMIALLFFMLTEMRLRFSAVSEAVFLPVCMAATLLAGSNSIGGLIYMAVEGHPLYASIMHDFLLFGLFLYALTRLISYLLPSLVVKTANTADPADVRTFEPEAPIHTAQTETPYAQESFDFDASDVAEAKPSADDSAAEEQSTDNETSSEG